MTLAFVNRKLGYFSGILSLFYSFRLRKLCSPLFGLYFFTIATTQPPLYGAEIVITRPPWMVFFIRR